MSFTTQICWGKHFCVAVAVEAQGVVEDSQELLHGDAVREVDAARRFYDPVRAVAVDREYLAVEPLPGGL